MNTKTLAIFDFDGTLTSKDTFLELIKYHNGFFRYWLGIIQLSPIILLHLMNVIPNWRAKECVLSFFFKGISLEEFESLCEAFAKKSIPSIIKLEAQLKLDWHKMQGHDIAIVSASAENWLKAWCESNNVTLVATRLEIENGCLTGRLMGKNCYGPEKLVRLKERYNLECYSEIYVYGDSRGDREILSIATHPFYRKF